MRGLKEKENKIANQSKSNPGQTLFHSVFLDIFNDQEKQVTLTVLRQIDHFYTISYTV